MTKKSAQTQTRDPERTATLAFRASDMTLHLVRAVAARQQLSPSDWLREVVETALQEEWSAHGSDVQGK